MDIGVNISEKQSKLEGAGNEGRNERNSNENQGNVQFDVKDVSDTNEFDKYLQPMK